MIGETLLIHLIVTDFYLQKDLEGLGAGGSCGPTQNILCQNPEAAIVLTSAAVVLRTVQRLVNASNPE